MSVFKVQLTNVSQGLLDTNGQSAGTSIQRGIYVMGPNRINRLLKDGATFTDSNYWKRYAFPQVPQDQAIVALITDDGSVWTDYPPSARVFPVVQNFTIAPNTTDYTQNVLDFLGTYGSRAIYAQIVVTGANAKCRINGSVIIDVTTTTVQIFNPGDLDITKLEFANVNVGGANAVIQVMASVVSVLNT